MNDNPFAVLTAIVAPAILTNACSVLALGTSNRIARVVDRTRIVINEIASAGDATPTHASLLTQLQRLRRRSRLLLGALRILYASLGGFAACASISVIGALAAYYELTVFFHVAAVCALIVGLAAVAGVVAGCIVMVAETRLALQSVDEIVDDTLARRPL